MVSAVLDTDKPADGDLPSYADVRSSQSSSAALRTEHTFSLNTVKGNPWISLHVTSRAPSPKTLPVFRDGDEIVGSVKINLDKPESCKGITIAVRQCSHLFLYDGLRQSLIHLDLVLGLYRALA